MRNTILTSTVPGRPEFWKELRRATVTAITFVGLRLALSAHSQFVLTPVPWFAGRFFGLGNVG